MYIPMDKWIIIPALAVLVLLAGCVAPDPDQDISFPLPMNY
jgi:hypothetical protein